MNRTQIDRANSYLKSNNEYIVFHEYSSQLAEHSIIFVLAANPNDFIQYRVWLSIPLRSCASAIPIFFAKAPSGAVSGLSFVVSNDLSFPLSIGFSFHYETVEWFEFSDKLNFRAWPNPQANGLTICFCSWYLPFSGCDGRDIKLFRAFSMLPFQICPIEVFTERSKPWN